MTLSPISSSLSYGLYGYLAKSAGQTQTALDAQTSELSTGKRANMAVQLGGGLGDAMNLRRHHENADAIIASNTKVSSFLDAAQSAIGAIKSIAESAQKQILTATGAGGDRSGMQAIANEALNGVLSTLNADASGQPLFAGVNSGAAPMAPFTISPPSASQNAIIQAFQNAFGAPPQSPSNMAIDTLSMQNFLNGAFADQFSGANWSANWSQASTAPLTAEISPGQTVAYSMSANDPSIQKIVQGLAMVAGIGMSTLNSATQSAICQKASELLGDGLGELSDAGGALGIVQSDTTFATDSLKAQTNYLQTCVSNLEDADVEKVSATLASLTTQLEATYSLTHLMSQLSLTNYITGG